MRTLHEDVKKVELSFEDVHKHLSTEKSSEYSAESAFSMFKMLEINFVPAETIEYNKK